VLPAGQISDGSKTPYAELKSPVTDSFGVVVGSTANADEELAHEAASADEASSLPASFAGDDPEDELELHAAPIAKQLQK
jgi:hypothetical protein